MSAGQASVVEGVIAVVLVAAALSFTVLRIIRAALGSKRSCCSGDSGPRKKKENYDAWGCSRAPGNDRRYGVDNFNKDKM